MTTEIRARVDDGIYTLAKAIAPFKNSGKDWNMPLVLTEALTDWLSKPENIEIIEKHSLLALVESRGQQAPEKVTAALSRSGDPE